jgi:hypothetical protein
MGKTLTRDQMTILIDNQGAFSLGFLYQARKHLIDLFDLFFI